MKNIIFVLSILLCFSLLIFGKIQYDSKLKGIAQEAQSTFEVSEQPEMVQKQEQVNSNVASIQAREIHPQLQDKLINAINNKENFRLAIAGSNAIATSEDTQIPWPKLVIEELNDTYGESTFDVMVYELGNSTTQQVLENGLHNEIAEFQPDVLLFEPLILNDNNNFVMDVTLSNITTILTDIRDTSPDVFVVLQPPNPIYRPNYFLQQARELKLYAEENDYVYIDHWEAWPSITDAEIQNFIEGTRPNQKGHDIWASVISEFFLGE
ncbi:MAG: SGNH/GDSL hydrolase family protein [Bacillaceae bacterium]|nr:SGNH/GDSL hydrolase family protein [Bacillaceae bacterium]